MDHVSIDFVGVPRSGSSPLVVDFTANVVIDDEVKPLYAVAEYNWFFDYENNPTVYETTTSPTISHVYTGYHKQTFSVTLSAIIEVTKPIADFSFVLQEGSNTIVDFTDLSTVVIGSIDSWDWDFGDGKTSTTQNPSNDYGVA